MKYPINKVSINISNSKKENIVFIHANGYTPESYNNIIKSLAKNYNVSCFLLRPLQLGFENRTIDSWKPLVSDLIDFINKYNNEKIIGIGHSIGGNILLNASIRRPNAFKKIHLLDPAIFVPYRIYIYKILSNFGLEEYVHPLLKIAKSRRDIYKNQEEIFSSYRRKNIFNKISDKNLKILISSLFTKNKNNYKLIFPKKWEYQLYKTGLHNDMAIWNNLAKHKVPTNILVPSKSDALLPGSIKKIKKINSNINFCQIKNSTHLFPFEYPDKTVKIILG